MKYQILEDIIIELTSKTIELNSKDIKEDLYVNDFIKKVMEISTNALKKLKNFSDTIDNVDLKKYLAREFKTVLDNNNKALRLAVNYAGGNENINLPININLSYNDIKNKTSNFQSVYQNILLNAKKECDRKAKDCAQAQLYDLKFELTTIQDRLENYENKIADAF